MARISHDGSVEFRGPWLLTLESLKELGAIFDRALSSSVDDWEHAIATKLNARPGVLDRPALERRHPRPRIEYHLDLGPKRQIIGTSIDDIRSHRDIATERLKSLQIKVSWEGGSYSLAVRKGARALSTSVAGTSSHADMFLADIREWAFRYGPTTIQATWLRFRPLVWIITIIALLIRVPDSASHQAVGTWKTKALEYAQHGIPQEEIPQALQVIIATQVVPEVQRARMSDREAVLWISAFVACVALSFCPSVIVGFGSGEASIRRWRIWMRLVTYTLPLLLFTTFAWPVVASWITSLIR